MTIEIISKADAVAIGSLRYFTGKACHRGHVSQRRVDNSSCIECNNEKSRARILTAEQMREYNRTNYKKNGAKIRASVKRYNAENADLIAEKRREYHQRKPWVKRILNAKRRTINMLAMPSWRSELDQLADVEAAELAQRRSVVTGVPWQVDHMIPLQAVEACGLHVGANLQVIPGSINLSKNNRMQLTEPGEWIGRV